jgi:hypothetical protein
MSGAIRHARSISPRGWIRQRDREPLSLAAEDRPFSDPFGRIVAFLPGAMPISARANCNTTTEHGPVAHPSGLCLPFNAHRPGIFGRFSPIRF